jgi:hypothetical protein
MTRPPFYGLTPSPPTIRRCRENLLCPNGATSFSPAVARNELPWVNQSKIIINPKGVVALQIVNRTNGGTRHWYCRGSPEANNVNSRGCNPRKCIEMRHVRGGVSWCDPFRVESVSTRLSVGWRPRLFTFIRFADGKRHSPEANNVNSRGCNPRNMFPNHHRP